MRSGHSHRAVPACLRQDAGVPAQDSPDVSSHTKLIEFYQDLAPDLPNLIVEFPFGDIYSRPALDKHQQALVTIAGLTAIAAEPQLELHINTGFNVGLTRDEVVGAIIHLIPYIGFPRCLKRPSPSSRRCWPNATTSSSHHSPRRHSCISSSVSARSAETSARTSSTRVTVYGYDLDTQRVAQWAEETGSALTGSDLAKIDWPTVESVHVAVRLANQVDAVMRSLQEATDLPLSVFINTTLSPTDARMITSSAPENWRVFEAPVSGGPQGARSGSLTIVLAGPQPTDAAASLLADESGHLFHLDSYGQPATVKLLNNTLATFNLAATARMLNLAAEHDVPAQKFIDVVAVSTGRSWMSDNLVDVQYDLLLKDVGLLRDELGELPVLDLAGNVEEQILAARKNLESAGS